MIIIEMIDNLALFYMPIVYIAGLGGPSKIIELRVDVLVLEPSFFSQRSS